MTSTITNISDRNIAGILVVLKALLPVVPQGHWINDYLDFESFKDQLLRDSDFAGIDFGTIEEPEAYDVALDVKKKLMGNEFINQCQQIAGRS